jgi:hypothetical protein
VDIRAGNVYPATTEDPRIQAIFGDAGEPISIALVGAGLIVPYIASVPFDEIMQPQHRALRVAFGILDRIRTGEVEGICFLCDARRGWRGFSCYAVVERARGMSRDKPAMILPICHQCDSISTQDTQRRITERLPLAPVPFEGAA